MKSYEFDPVMGLVDAKVRKMEGLSDIEPKPGKVYNFGGTRLMAVEDDGKDCYKCAVYENDYRLCMENSKKKCICLDTLCDAEYRRDRKYIHYEEVKDEERV